MIIIKVVFNLKVHTSIIKIIDKVVNIHFWVSEYYIFSYYYTSAY